jgi:hypothetical protein
LCRGDRDPVIPTPRREVKVDDNGLDAAIVRRYVQRRHEAVRACFERHLMADPSLSGTVMVDFVIGPTGAVAASNAKGVSAGVSSCVSEVISTIAFPSADNGGMTRVRYPFTMRTHGN